MLYAAVSCRVCFMVDYKLCELFFVIVSALDILLLLQMLYAFFFLFHLSVWV